MPGYGKPIFQDDMEEVTVSNCIRKAEKSKLQLLPKRLKTTARINNKVMNKIIIRLT
jgi:predicted transglutaminase-like cysteine proteinase